MYLTDFHPYASCCIISRQKQNNPAELLLLCSRNEPDIELSRQNRNTSADSQLPALPPIPTQSNTPKECEGSGHLKVVHADDLQKTDDEKIDYLGKKENHED